MPRVTGRINKRSGRIRINRTISFPQIEKHQLRIVIELNTEPVPSHLIGCELFGKPLMVHPRLSGDFVPAIRARNLSSSGKSRE